MRLILDVQPLLGQKTGIGNYTNNLLNEFIKKSYKIDLFTNQSANFKRLKDIQIESNNVVLKNKLYPYKVLRRLGPPTIFYELPIDLFLAKNARNQTIFHGTNFISLPTRYAKQVITIHDLAFMKFPEVVEQNIYEYMMRWVPYSIQAADQIIADSQQTKRDILELFEIPSEKIHVVYCAADDRFEKQSSVVVEQVKEKYSLPEQYILFIGTLEPRKNLVTLIDALHKLKCKYGSNVKLVIVGAKGWKFGPIFDKVKELELEDDIYFPGYVADEDLAAIYSGAQVFTFPSLYEGFGIPLLEAMQCEVPVIAANTSCIPEVVGDGGILLDPLDSTLWAEKINLVLTHEKLQSELITLGKEQATKFSWKKAANETLAVYKKALEG